MAFPGSAEARAALGLFFKLGNLLNCRWALLLVVCLTQTTYELEPSLGFGCFTDIMMLRSIADTQGDSWRRRFLLSAGRYVFTHHQVVPDRLSTWT